MNKMENFHLVKACGNGQSECAICCAFLRFSVTWDSMLYRIAFDTSDGSILSNTRYCYDHAVQMCYLLNRCECVMSDHGYIVSSDIDIEGVILSSKEVV